jgi:hypothetical protein
MRKTMLATAAAAAIVLTVGVSGANAAITFDSVGDTGSVYFDGYDGGPVLAGLTSNITYTLTGIAGNAWTFSYTINNTSSASASRVAVVGFDVGPDVKGGSAGVTSPIGVFTHDSQGGNVPMFGAVDVCLMGSNGNGCGGGNQGVWNTNSGQGSGVGQGSFVLNFSSNPGQVTLDDFVVKYQSVSGLDAASSAIGRETAPPATGAVPEPATWAMMLFGIFGAGAALRRRRRAMIAARI